MTPRDAEIEGAMQAYRSGNIRGAYEIVVRASFTRHSDPDIILILALCLSKLGRHEDSAKQWAHLACHAPSAYSGTNQLRHASALMECGELDDAKTLITDFVSLDNDDGFKLHLIRRLAELERAQRAG